MFKFPLDLDLRKKVILTYVGLSIFYAVIIGVFAAEWFNSIGFFWQFLIGILPIFVLFSIIIGGISNIKRIIGGFLLFMMSDVIAFPFLVGVNGVFSDGAVGSSGASDIFLASLLKGFGFEGFTLYFLTYVVIPCFFVGVAVYLLLSKNDLKKEF